MNKYICIFIFLLLQYFMLFATHNRAGEITYKQKSDLTYEITLITYTYTPSAANETRDKLEIQWGDNTSSMISRINETFLADNYTRNTYVGEHTYPGPGIYRILMEDPNRNYGVNNIPNSVGVVFSISTYLRIDPDLGYNNTPVLLYPPTDKAAVGKLFIHNPTAFDPDGDSLSYKLTTCTGNNGEYIPKYTLPESSNTALYVNPVTGDLVWDCPVKVGIYNVAMLIEEWRRGIKIGMITRDLQIEVLNSDNDPPVIDVLKKYCVEAGKTLKFNVTASDKNKDYITLTGLGGPFEVSPNAATFTPVSGLSQVTSTFIWNTLCSDVRKQPWFATFKAMDFNNDLSLIDIEVAEIIVVAPAPENVALKPTNNTILVSWSPSKCKEADGYRIFRRISKYGFLPDSCETGVPAYTGYIKIGENKGINDTAFLDNNNGAGLIQGHEYCYLVIAFFSDGAESYASQEICIALERGLPVITNVSVNKTGVSEGEMYVAWSKPNAQDFDTLQYPGPYLYKIYRSADIWGKDMKYLATLDKKGLNDTIFIDSALNTKNFPYSYKIELYSNYFLVGSPQIASSVFLNIAPVDNKLILNFEKNVPWINEGYTIYKQNKSTMNYDSLSYTSNIQYTDTGLVNGVTYCYKVKSTGDYTDSGFISPIINFSQENCEEPIDTIPPCPPVLSALSRCDSMRNELTWTNSWIVCGDEVVHYNVYFSDVLDGELKIIATLTDPSINYYFHYPKKSIAGCYAVTAVDSFLNESAYSNIICLDSCTFYELPNVITPDGDGHNDLMVPGPYYFVDHVEMNIYNRWGDLVFQTEDPDINWDGRDMNSHQIVSSGVYYYICNVYEYRLTGLEQRYIYGFVHVYGKESEKKP